MKRHGAAFWVEWKGQVACKLCPQACVLMDGEVGKCGVRKNVGDRLVSLSWGKVVAQNIDPIEKKPLFHFWPGSRAYSICTPGCNLSCEFCQNWQLSQEFTAPDWEVPPEQVVDNATQTRSQGIAHTYTEPTIFFEYSRDVARLAREEGLYNVWVSNGMINRKPAREASKFVDAVNVDIKGNAEFYRQHCDGVGLRPVKTAIREFHRQAVWVEVTNLLIPGVNDSEEDIREIVEFVAGVDKEIPLHFSRFRPHYKMKDKGATPVETVEKAVEMAREELDYVYAGNVPGHEYENTVCPECGELLVERHGFRLGRVSLLDAKCPGCGHDVPVVGKIIKPAGV